MVFWLLFIVTEYLQSLSDYQLSIVYKIPQLEKLDQIRLTPQIKVLLYVCTKWDMVALLCFR